MAETFGNHTPIDPAQHCDCESPGEAPSAVRGGRSSPSPARLAFERARTPGFAGMTSRAFGRVDVLVNNAGRGVVGAAEEVGEAEPRASLELHPLGPAALVRAVLPFFRAQGSGTIVQMSSQGGRLSFPGVGAYSAGRFALEGWSEALAGEVAPFVVRVMIVEPSRFRTSCNAPGVLDLVGAEVLGDVRADMTGADGVTRRGPPRSSWTWSRATSSRCGCRSAPRTPRHAVRTPRHDPPAAQGADTVAGGDRIQDRHLWRARRPVTGRSGGPTASG